MSYHPIRNSAQLAPEAVRFQSIAPGAELSEYVVDFWQYDVRSCFERVPIQVFPSGCVVLRFTVSAAGVEPVLYGPSLRSNMQSVFVIGASDFGVALTFEGARAILGCDVAAVSDQRLDLHAFWPRRVDELCERLWSAGTFSARVAVLRAFLLDAASGRRAPPADFLEAIDRLKTTSRTAGLSAACRVSLRTLRRYFDQNVGLSPKQVARVVRVQRTMRVLCQAPNFSHADLAADVGFSDQPHFNREFKRLLGMRPGEFARCVGGFHDPTLPIWRRAVAARAG